MDSDPLLLLRAALSADPSQSSIQWLDSASEPTTSLAHATHISLPSTTLDASPIVLPKSTSTRYTSAASGAVTAAAGSAVPTYDLQTLVFAFQLRDAGVGDYVKNAREANVEFVGITDRRAVIDWLSGKSELENPRILPLGQPAASTAPPTTATAASDQLEPLASSPSKRPLDSTSVPTSASQDAAGADQPSAAKKMHYTPDRDDVEKMKRLMQIVEGPPYAYLGPDGNRVEKSGYAIKNRETVLRGDRTNNFASVLSLLTPRLRLMKEDHFEPRQAPKAPGAVSTDSAPVNKSARRKNLNPIILLSPSETALLSLHNVKRFLEDSVFVESSEAKRQAGGEETDMVIVHHARSTATISSVLNSGAEVRKARYFIVNSVEALAKFGSLDDAWDRVVCVMTTGQEWQFRPYKWREPKELFHHVKGIFVQYTTDAPNPKVRSWNVTELRIDPKARHIDKSTVADFWRSLEAWIAMYKPHLHV